jgi:hypothetical protein
MANQYDLDDKDLQMHEKAHGVPHGHGLGYHHHHHGLNGNNIGIAQEMDHMAIKATHSETDLAKMKED